MREEMLSTQGVDTVAAERKLSDSELKRQVRTRERRGQGIPGRRREGGCSGHPEKMRVATATVYRTLWRVAGMPALLHPCLWGFCQKQILWKWLEGSFQWP